MQLKLLSVIAESRPQQDYLTSAKGFNKYSIDLWDHFLKLNISEFSWREHFWADYMKLNILVLLERTLLNRSHEIKHLLVISNRALLNRLYKIKRLISTGENTPEQITWNYTSLSFTGENTYVQIILAIRRGHNATIPKENFYPYLLAFVDLFS